ncbi:putative alpha-E superfamily protein [Rhodovulum bhavnagarense]|uniref:Putative alpha-E superfamily protein n=1 Tax=Rhodovulum bhavnagarense TaxID=992286 RepID=A0A4R2RJC6_9RHOB|nr:alpha-E domain-containing protein [Rhodovulum bhavnagarense]TCP62848.1 putative alpha-E superfamily protein [Rhodovulum bhavnagarense]
MLSRTANGLFWMSRYVERMENVARLLDAGHRMENLPQLQGAKSTEWRSIVIASGCRTTFPQPLEQASRNTVPHHLVFDDANPSSIRQCARAARENARAMRTALTSEVWDTLNQSWADLRHRRPEDTLGGRELTEFLDWVKSRGALVRGHIDATILRDEGYAFIELGKWIERADATARILDVKYHVLLPKSSDVGGGLDYLQWLQVLRAANSATAYRHLYRRTIDPEGVVDLLVLNARSPRSLVTGVQGICAALVAIGVHTGAQRATHARAVALREDLRSTGVDAIIMAGLHEWLTGFISEINALATELGAAYGFDGHEVTPGESLQ